MVVSKPASFAALKASRTNVSSYYLGHAAKVFALNLKPSCWFNFFANERYRFNGFSYIHLLSMYCKIVTRVTVSNKWRKEIYMEVYFIVLYGNIYDKTQQVDETNLDSFLMRAWALILVLRAGKKESRADTLPCNCWRTMTRRIVLQLSLSAEKQRAWVNTEEICDYLYA